MTGMRGCLHRIARRVLSRRLSRKGCLARLASDDGGSLVELALTSAVTLSLLFGVFEVSMALYSYHFVAEAAREGSRFAMVRGFQCPTNVTVSYCSPTAANTTGAVASDVSHYVANLGVPFARNLTVTTTWLSKSQDANGFDIWTACTTAPCNMPTTNAVQVTVTYAYPLNIPFSKKFTINMGSKSMMVISQ